MEEIREISPEERKKKIEELKVELGKFKTTVEAGGTIENPSRIHEIRRAIARIITVQREKGDI
jgi:large subunit ribosomal protein L29